MRNSLSDVPSFTQRMREIVVYNQIVRGYQ